MKIINNFENYTIDEKGNVYSIRRKKYLKQNIDRYGYKYVQLSKKNIHKKFKIHRLVAEHYIPNPENKATVNHKNGQKLINEDWNLEWMTFLENSQHAARNGLMKIRKGKDSILSKSVDVYSVDGIFLSTEESMNIAAEKYNITTGSISYQCRNRVIKTEDKIKYYFRFTGDKLQSFDIICKYNKDKNLIETYRTIKEAADRNNLFQQNIGHVIKHKPNQLIGGYYWRRNKCGTTNFTEISV